MDGKLSGQLWFILVPAQDAGVKDITAWIAQDLDIDDADGRR